MSAKDGSRWSTQQETSEKRREERRERAADASYEAWRRGEDPDAAWLDEYDKE